MSSASAENLFFDLHCTYLLVFGHVNKVLWFFVIYEIESEGASGL